MGPVGSKSNLVKAIVPVRWQGISWTNNDLVYWCIYGSTGPFKKIQAVKPWNSWLRQAGCWTTSFMNPLTHWDRVTHICVGKLTTIGSDNGLSPGRCQTIFWTNAGIFLIVPLGTNFSEILIGIQTFSFKKMHLKMSAKWLEESSL